MKTKYLINNLPVQNLAQWCKSRGLLIGTFDKAIHRAKAKGSNECHCLGFYVIRLKGGE